MSHYLGHHADGSSIQNHSVGGNYPFVIAYRQRGETMRVEVIGPGINGALSFESHADAQSCIDRLLQVRENADAWSFELENVSRIIGQVSQAVRRAAYAYVAGKGLESARWADLSKSQRVECLLTLGRARLDASGPAFGIRPVFAEYAARLEA
jgi:hypothetical protein